MDPRGQNGPQIAEAELRRMMEQARPVGGGAGPAQPVGGTFEQEIHTQWSVRVLDASALGPMFEFGGAGADEIKFVTWDVPGKRVFFIANDDLLRAVIGDLTAALSSE